MNKMMKYMLMSEMMKGTGGFGTGSGMNSMLPFMMMGGGGFGDMFEGMFDGEDDGEDDDTVSETEED